MIPADGTMVACVAESFKARTTKHQRAKEVSHSKTISYLGVLFFCRVAQSNRGLSNDRTAAQLHQTHGLDILLPSEECPSHMGR